MERTNKPVMRTDRDMPRNHTVVFDASGEDVTGRFISLVKAASAGDVMARVNSAELAKECTEKVTPYFQKLGPGLYTCHPATWRGMSDADRGRFRLVRIVPTKESMRAARRHPCQSPSVTVPAGEAAN